MDEERLKLFFEPVKSKEELRLWLKIFLDVALPDETVDEESNSNPLQFVWEVYSAMLSKTGPKRFVAAVSRNCSKTLCATIIRFISMVWLRRSGTHLAANLQQSQSATLYFEKFLLIPEIAPYIKINNTRTKEFAGLPPNSWTKLGTCNVRVTTATIKGVNSQRGNFNVVDECDLIDSIILSEKAWIADPTPEGLPPVEVSLSSRKSNSGPIQRLISEAESGEPSISLHKWSVVDWMRKCPAEVHKPELGKVHAWLNIENLKTTWGVDAYNVLSDVEKGLQRKCDVFAGCKTCSAFTACLGRSEKRNSNRGRLRDEQFVGNVLKEAADPAVIIAQGLNWKAETSAVVFRQFNKRTHFFKAIEFYKWCIGSYFVPEGMDIETVNLSLLSKDEVLLAEITPDKQQIYEALRHAGWKVHYGIDYGSIDPAVCVVGAYHKPTRRLAILHTSAMTGYPNEDWAKYVHKNIWSHFPCDLVCPDMADINSPIYFGRLGMPCRNKKPARIETGVSQLRSFLWNPVTQQAHFAILDDGELGLNRWTVDCLEKWTYKRNVMGYDYKHFEDNDYTHPCFVPGMLVTTKKGTIPIEDIKIGDQVLTRIGDFQTVTNVMSRHYDGEIVSITPSGSLEILCTPDHPFWVGKAHRHNGLDKNGVKLTGQLVRDDERFWLPAGKLNITKKNAQEKFFTTCRVNPGTQNIVLDMKQHLPYWAEFENRLYPTSGKSKKCPNLKKRSVPLNVTVDSNMAFLIGYYVAEGSCGHTRRSVSFAGHIKETGVMELLDSVMSKIDGNRAIWSPRKDTNGRKIIVNSSALYSIVSNLGKETDKHFPDWSLDASPEVRLGLLAGYLFGDGCFTKGHLTANGISSNIMFTVRNLFISLGYPARIKFAKRKGRWGVKRDQYVVSVNIENTNTFLESLHKDWLTTYNDKDIRHKTSNMPSNKQWCDNNELSALIRKISTKQYSGMVYNLEVGSDHTYTVNGMAVSNCDSIRYLADPWITDMKATFSVTQPDSEIKQFVANKLANPQMKSLKELEQETMKEIENHYKEEFGLTDIFAEENKLKASSAKKLVINSDDYIKKPKDPNDTEPLPTSPRSRIKFKF